MTSLSEISVVRVPSSADDGSADVGAEPLAAPWTPLEGPRSRGRSPVTLAVLALLAGLGAMALGAVAVVYATRSSEDAQSSAATVSAVGPDATQAERRALALLAKPSTDRVVFSGSGGRAVLVVGSGGRAAIVLRGFDRSSSARPYLAWVVGSGRPVRAARFTGGERAVVLSAPVGRGDSVVIGTDRAAALRPATARIVATRG
jgi:hypothetical protein